MRYRRGSGNLDPGSINSGSRFSGGQNQPRLGDVALVRYHDHSLFRDQDPAQFPRTWVRETVGRLDYQDDECIRLVWERFLIPSSEESEPRAVGVTIYKKAIVEMKRFG